MWCCCCVLTFRSQTNVFDMAQCRTFRWKLFLQKFIRLLLCYTCELPRSSCSDSHISSQVLRRPFPVQRIVGERAKGSPLSFCDGKLALLAVHIGMHGACTWWPCPVVLKRKEKVEGATQNQFVNNSKEFKNYKKTSQKHFWTVSEAFRKFPKFFKNFLRFSENFQKSYKLKNGFEASPKFSGNYIDFGALPKISVNFPKI